jgi:molecular chaperone GrpE
MEKRFNHDDNELRENASPDGPVDKDIELTPDQEVKAEPADAPDSAIAKLQAQIAEKDKELAELKDRYLRALADSENARKRMRQQSDETVRMQRENLLRELLPIIDNLERAVEAARGGGNGQPIVEGVEMVLRSLLDLLKTHGVTQLSSVGEPFDPQRHEAVDQVESQQHPPNTVVNEFHRGYQIGDRLLRPARVAVAKRTRENSQDGNANGSGGDDVETR